jgi:hypothetical protein
MVAGFEPIRSAPIDRAALNSTLLLNVQSQFSILNWPRNLFELKARYAAGCRLAGDLTRKAPYFGRQINSNFPTAVKVGSPVYEMLRLRSSRVISR